MYACFNDSLQLDTILRRFDEVIPFLEIDFRQIACK